MWGLLLLLPPLACEQERRQPPPAPAAIEPQVATRESDPALPGIARPDAKLTEALRRAADPVLKRERPRSHHLHPDGRPRYINRLVREASPYLLQHAFNPVNFFAWGPEALQRARRLDRPILLSVGYSTCHWCHVMERESFDDEEIAAFMNAHFVCIKVDREQRPDLDSVYMTAVNLLTGRGGWPMTVMLTPELEPFFGGTYFPARDGDRGARRGFLTILREMSERYQSDREGVLRNAAQVSKRLRELSKPAPAAAVAGKEALVAAARGLARDFDVQWGGFGGAPKFPQPARLRFLLRYARRSGDPGARRMVEHTLLKMADGGIYDQVGGGFHRYSVDARFLVPHFEKMLYDNAQLALAYLEGFQLTGNPEFARVVRETLDYVAREMVAPQGGFYSATDADSDTPGGHQEEGYFFTWSPAEIADALGPELTPAALSFYGVSSRGNFEGRNILHRPRSASAVAAELGIGEGQLAQRLQQARPRLLQARKRRPAPARDDKVVTAWNGLMIGAFARASFVLGRPDYLQRAERAADFILKTLRASSGRLVRSALGERAGEPGYLEDHAFMVEALLELFEASAEPRWLREAIAIQKELDAHFSDPEAGGYFRTSDDHERLLVREKPDHDGALPSGNSVAALSLLRLADLTADMTYRARAEAVIAALSAPLSRGGGLARLLLALDYATDSALQVIVVHPDDSEPAPQLLEPLRRGFAPNRVMLVLSEAQVSGLREQVPVLAGKVAIGGKATAYVCEQGRCELPTSDPKAFSRQLAQHVKLLADGNDPPPLAL
ncbi:MAG: thioredoxin domain-containing protein [Myxococcales bacterium]|nr:thioredoxin domain-containing protein [Myxococcales bacterium]